MTRSQVASMLATLSGVGAAVFLHDDDDVIVARRSGERGGGEQEQGEEGEQLHGCGNTSSSPEALTHPPA